MAAATGAAVGEMVDCWVRLENLFFDLRFCLERYHREQAGSSTMNLQAVVSPSYLVSHVYANSSVHMRLYVYILITEFAC